MGHLLGLGDDYDDVKDADGSVTGATLHRGRHKTIMYDGRTGAIDQSIVNRIGRLVSKIRGLPKRCPRHPADGLYNGPTEDHRRATLEVRNARLVSVEVAFSADCRKEFNTDKRGFLVRLRPNVSVASGTFNLPFKAPRDVEGADAHRGDGVVRASWLTPTKVQGALDWEGVEIIPGRRAYSCWTVRNSVTRAAGAVQFTIPRIHP